MNRNDAIFFAVAVICARKIIDLVDKQNIKGNPFRHHGFEIFARQTVQEVSRLSKLVDEELASLAKNGL